MRLLILCSLLALTGCTDATIAKNASYGSEFKVTLYSGGNAVKEWTSSGRVSSETDTDGWFFQDKATGKLVRVSGDVSVEQK